MTPIIPGPWVRWAWTGGEAIFLSVDRGWLLFLATSALHAWRFHRISKHEGQQLIAARGDAYRSYESVLPRWISLRAPGFPAVSLAALASTCRSWR